MKRKHPSIGMNEVSEEGGIVHEFCKPSDVVKLGYLIWVKLHPSSWWPAQVVDAETVSEFVKPIERLVGEVLVRVYGSYIYLYVDPTESRIEFEKVLKRYDGNYDAILEEALAKDRPRSTKSKVATLAEASQSTGSTLASAAKCGKKNKSAEKKTAAVDKETSVSHQLNIHHFSTLLVCHCSLFTCSLLLRLGSGKGFPIKESPLVRCLSQMRAATWDLK
uniref:PWWP domain-containing protein n=1 Tax=Kalanchoe fedtschenkoi TaxID=63787 RepID=A0A7N0USC6_KALFE